MLQPISFFPLIMLPLKVARGLKMGIFSFLKSRMYQDHKQVIMGGNLICVKVAQSTLQSTLQSAKEIKYFCKN